LGRCVRTGGWLGKGGVRSGVAAVIGIRARVLRRLTRLDLWIVGTAVVAGLFGLVVQRVLGLTLERPLAETHAVGLLFGGVAASAFSRLSPESVLRGAFAAYAAGLVGVALCLAPGIGVEMWGVRRWVDLGLFQVAPGPIAVLTLVPVLARTFRTEPGGSPGGGLSWSFLLAPAPLLLLLLVQPDTSSVIVTLFLLAALFAVEWPGPVMGRLVAGAAVALAEIVFVILQEPYRLRRMLINLDPYVDPQGDGFVGAQIRSILAAAGPFGNGRIIAARPDILPDIESDNVVVAVGAVAGVPGIVMVTLPLVLLVLLGGEAALRAVTAERRRLALGVTFLFGFQTLTNLCVVAGIIPAKYELLPFVSAGPSALLAQGAAVGLLLSSVSAPPVGMDSTARGSGQTVSRT
jgi:cell division protein FtsW